MQAAGATHPIGTMTHDFARGGRLGRGVVVLPGDAPPLNWASCPRVVIDAASLEDPGPVAEELHGYWFTRRPVVVELAVDPAALRAPEHCGRPVYELTPRFEFSREHLQFLVWANNYDARGGEPIWWHGRKAARLCAGEGVREGRLAGGWGRGGGRRRHRHWPTERPSTSTGAHHNRRSSDRGSGGASVERGGGTARPAGGVQAPSHLRSGPTRGRSTTACRAGPGDRPGGLGKDPGADRASPAPRHRLRRASRHAHRAGVQQQGGRRNAAALRADIDGGPGLNIRTLNSLGLWICNEFGTGGHLRVLEEPAVRDLLQRLIEIRRQSNTDTVAPYIEALSAIRLGLTAPHLVEEAIPDAAGIAEGFDRYRAALAEAGCGRLRRADLRGHRDPADRSGGTGGRPGEVPLPPGGRVPGPQPGAPPPHQAPGAPRPTTASGSATTIRSFTGTPAPPPNSSSTTPATFPAPAPTP